MLGWRFCLGNRRQDTLRCPTFTVGSSGLADARLELTISSDAGPAAILGDHTKAVVKRREKIMIKTVAIVVFGLAVASAAQAMPPAPVLQPDSIITQARMGCGAGMVMVNGACVARTTIRHARRCARWNGGVCAHYY